MFHEFLVVFVTKKGKSYVASILDGAIKNFQVFDVTLFVDIHLRKSTSKSILPEHFYFYIS